MKKIIKIVLFIASLSFINTQIIAKPQYSDVLTPKELITALQSGGYILYMRHGATTRKKSNNIQMDLGNCETQRNLSTSGLAEVEKIGQIIKSLNIPISTVLSSPYCRTKDTAKAAFGNYNVDPKLAFSFSKNKTESDALGQYLFQIMSASNNPDNNIVFVGHTANLKDGLGVWPKPEGVMAIFKKEQEKVVFKGMIKPADWLSF